MSQQMLLSLIDHEVNGEIIPQRITDGYINATALCKASGKKFSDYSRRKNTELFLDELFLATGIPVRSMVVAEKGGTWVHPDIAVNLAQWLSPKFAVAVSKWVRDWMTGKSTGGTLPYHLRRYMKNSPKIPPTHFSILNELIFGLIAPMEHKGYMLPENMVPDISEGRMFCKWLRDKKDIDTDSLPTYTHEYEDGRKYPAKMYPISLLEDFRKHFYGTWIPRKAVEYFKKRDPYALPHLEALMIEQQQQPLLG